MQKWIDSLKDVFTNGKARKDRTGVGRISTFGRMIRYNLLEGFPLVTSKFTSFHSIKHELLWMLSGSTRLKYLKDNRVSIWDEWVKPHTAIIRPYTAEEMVRLIKQDNGSGLDQIIANLEQKIADGTGGHAVFYTSHVNDTCPENRTAIFCKRPTEDELANQYEKLAGLLKFLYSMIVDTLQVKFGAGGILLDALTTQCGLPSIERFPDWKKQVFLEGTWEDVLFKTANWPFEIIDGDLGPVYGKQMVRWQPGIDPDAMRAGISELENFWDDRSDISTVSLRDLENLFEELTPKPINQIQNIVNLLKHDPTSSRILMNLWNVGELGEMALPPCHVMTQFYSDEMSTEERLEHATKHFIDFYEDWQSQQGHAPLEGYDAEVNAFMDNYGIPKRRLSAMLYQRSCDKLLGESFNVGFYALLTHMLAQVTDHAVGEFIHVQGDTHIYANHVEGYEEIIQREPLPLCKLVLNKKVNNIFDFTGEDISIVDYQHHPSIKLEVAV